MGAPALRSGEIGLDVDSIALRARRSVSNHCRTNVQATVGKRFTGGGDRDFPGRRAAGDRCGGEVPRDPRARTRRPN